MGNIRDILKHIVTAALATVWFSIPAPLPAGEPGEADQLLDELARAGENEWKPIEDRLWEAWGRSGSAAMDLLLKRGQDAIEAGDYVAAVEHLTALIDHAPDFAEGYDTRALAFYRLGRYGPALADIRKTLALNPRHFGALSGLAAILEETGHEEEALVVLRRVLEIHPHKPEALEAVKRLSRKIEGEAL